MIPILCLLVFGGQWGCVTEPEVAPQLPAQASAPEVEVILSDVPLGPGDELEVTVYRESELTRLIRIPRSGIIFMPLVGELQASGLSQGELRRELTKGLSKHLINPQVSIEMTAHRSQKVVVLGEVPRPGIFILEGPMRILEAVGMAGGFAITANREHVVLMHQQAGDPSSEIIDLDGILEKGLGENPMLKAGDVVFIPPQQIVDWARYARNVELVIRPFMLMEQGILLGYDVSEALKGNRTGGDVIVIPGQPPEL